MADLFTRLTFPSGPAMKNRFMLAPMTNQQSHDDGTLSDDEHRWLTMRAAGGFGATMTCASHVQAAGQGFPGQLGCFSEDHGEGLARLAAGLREHDSVSILQLHHAGMRSPQALIGQAPLCPSENEKFGARALTHDEVHRLRGDFIAAARRAEAAGFDGVEIHGAHGYILCQFLDPDTNRRDDEYGGSPENRARLVREIIDGIREQCRPDFLLGLRLSPEGYGFSLGEIRDLARELCAAGRIDFLDMSLWDCFKEPEDDAFRGRTLLSCFTELDRGAVRLGVAGKILGGAEAHRCVGEGADFVLPGRAAILHHDLPRRIREDASFTTASLPVTREHLRAEGLGEKFVQYMTRWKGFVAE